MSWLSPDEFGDAVMDYARTAWRWECQGQYREPSEGAPIQAWREGRIEDSYRNRPWLAEIRSLRAEGRTWQRVRMLTDPLTEYLRWMLDTTFLNVDAGEDIRWIQQARAAELGMQGYDFYLLDDERVLRMHFAEQGLSGAELTTDPGEVARHCRWRDLAWGAAIPHAQYRMKDTNAT